MTCADPEKFVRGVPALTVFLFDFTVFVIYFRGGLVDDGRKGPNTTKRGPGPMVPNKWWLGRCVIFQESGLVLLRNPITL